MKSADHSVYPRRGWETPEIPAEPRFTAPQGRCKLCRALGTSEPLEVTVGAHCLPGGCSGCLSVAQRAAGGGAAEGARFPGGREHPRRQPRPGPGGYTIVFVVLREPESFQPLVTSFVNFWVSRCVHLSP